MSNFSKKLTQLSIESIFSNFEREKRVELKEKVPVLRSIHVPIHIPELVIYASITSPSLSPDNKRCSGLLIRIETDYIFPPISIEMSESLEKTKVTIGGRQKYSSFGWETLFRNFLNFLVFRTGNTVEELYLCENLNLTDFFEKPPNGVNSLTIQLETEWPLDFLMKFQNLRYLDCRFHVKVPKGYFKHENFQHLESLQCDSESKGIENSLELLDFNFKKLAVYESSSSYDTFLTFVKKFSTGRYSIDSEYGTTALNLTKDELFENLLLDVPARETTRFPWNPPKIFQPNILTIDIWDEMELNISFDEEDSYVTCTVRNAGTTYPRIISREVVENKRIRLE